MQHLPTPNRIAFQGAPGAYSDLACREAFPGVETVPCRTFADAFASVRDGACDLAMIPIDNTTAGRVADIHHLMPSSGIHIVGEYFRTISHHLMVLPDADETSIKTVHSHVHALSQCRNMIERRGLHAVVSADTAGAAAELAAEGDVTQAVIASELAAEIYGLKIIERHVEDTDTNSTRFMVMALEPIHPDLNDGPCVTTCVFRVRSVPASLYKALGGFATNGVNITKLESYISSNRFDVARFYMDIEGHPDNRSVRLAMEELGFFSREVKILGVYPASPLRIAGGGDDD